MEFPLLLHPLVKSTNMAIQLSFQCDESWDKMPNTNQGKFCGKCSKNIYDLTDKSESEIHQLYKENNGKLCGKIRPQQLNNSIYTQQRTKLAKFCLALFLVFGGNLFKSELHAQNNVIDSTITLIESNNEYYTINGIILEEGTNDPLPFANVHYEVNDKNIGTATDFDGKFTLKIIKGSVPNDSIDLIVSYIGYNKLKILGLDLRNSINNEIHLERKLHQDMTVGMIIISCPPIINKDPESHGTTIITGDELRRSPY